MAWRIERQANGLFAIFSTRINDYIVIDADPVRMAQIYGEKGVRVYLASARMQMDRQVAVPAEAEALIEASRLRGVLPKEGDDVPIGVTGVMLGGFDE